MHIDFLKINRACQSVQITDIYLGTIVVKFFEVIEQLFMKHNCCLQIGNFEKKTSTIKINKSTSLCIPHTAGWERR